MRIHAPCGDVYLQEYCNVDIVGRLAATLDGKNPNATTLDNYYKRPFDLSQHQREIIVDMQMDITEPWIFHDSAADEVLIISSIEHFLPAQAEHIVAEAYRVLKKGGRLVVDYPDIPEIVRAYADDPDMMARMIYCSHKNEHSIHKWLYLPKSIRQLLCEAIPAGQAWGDIFDHLVVKHDYPMRGIVSIK